MGSVSQVQVKRNKSFRVKLQVPAEIKYIPRPRKVHPPPPPPVEKKWLKIFIEETIGRNQEILRNIYEEISSLARGILRNIYEEISSLAREVL